MKKRLPNGAKALIDKYRFFNTELDRYQGSVFYTGNPNDSRCTQIEADQKSIAEKFLKLTGFPIDTSY
jgi:hypothetical protein